MRIIAGRAKGCRLLPVSGLDTRPTTDRVKENVFNLLQMQLYDAKVLDLFAGTGQLGLEALSRGAAHCDFVEQSQKAFAVLTKNVQQSKMGDWAGLHCTSAARFVETAQRKHYDFVFLDPPYGGKLLEQALFLVERFDILSKDGIIICESAKADCFTHHFSVKQERIYGATKITLLQRVETEENSL